MLVYLTLLFLMIAGITALVIVIKNKMAVARTNSVIHKARSGKLNYEKLREQLMYRQGPSFTTQKNVPFSDTEQMTHILRNLQVMGTRVIDVQRMTENELLLIAETSFHDQVANVGGNANIERKFSTFYILRFFPDKNEFALFSDLFENEDTKRARDRFRDKLIELVF